MMTAHKRHPIRVVVADDSAVFRTALIRLLATLPNLEVIAQAANGQEALQLVEELAPDLLILDIQMPVMDGLEVLRHLQAMASNVQVVMLSAHGDSYANEVLARGTTVFVPKGDVPQLRTTLSELV